jgi:hypothetical protein
MKNFLCSLFLLAVLTPCLAQNVTPKELSVLRTFTIKVQNRPGVKIVLLDTRDGRDVLLVELYPNAPKTLKFPKQYKGLPVVVERLYLSSE